MALRRKAEKAAASQPVRISRNEFVIAGTMVSRFIAKHYTVITVISRNSKPNFPRIFCYNDCKRYVDELAEHSNITIKGRISTFREKNEGEAPRQVMTAEKVELSQPTMKAAFGDSYTGNSYLYPSRNDLYLAGEVVYVSGTDKIKKYLIKTNGPRYDAFIQVTQYVQRRAPVFSVGNFINAYCSIQTVRKERDGNFVDFTNFVVMEAHLVKDEADEEDED